MRQNSNLHYLHTSIKAHSQHHFAQVLVLGAFLVDFCHQLLAGVVLDLELFVDLNPVDILENVV